MFEDESKVLCPINVESIMKILKLSNLESHKQILVNEENFIMLFMCLSLEDKSKELRRFLKSIQSIEQLSLSYPLHAFAKRVNYVITMVN